MKNRPTSFLNAGAAVAGVLAFSSAATDVRADYATTVLANHPAAYWRLNETTPVPAGDAAFNSGSLGASANGFYSGTAFHPANGALVGSADTAAAYDGTASSITAVPYQPALNPNAPFTVEAWFSPNVEYAAGSGTLNCALSCGHFASPRSGWLIYQSETGWNFRMYAQSGTAVSASVTGGTAPVAGNWYHVVAVYDGSTVVVYVNGVASTPATPSGYVPGTDGALYIGGRSDNSFWWNGAADEVALYPKALTAAEVTAHYQNGISASPATPYDQLVTAAGPLAYYRLNEAPYNPPATLPVAKNDGSLGAGGDGSYNPGMAVGVAGPSAPKYHGFGANNTAGAFNGVLGAVTTPVTLNDLPAFTVMGWVKRGAVKSGRGGYFGQNDLLEFGDANSGASIEAWINAYGGNIVVNYPFPDNEWGFIALTGNDTKSVLYFNGSVAATKDGSVASYGTSSYFFNIGGGGIFNPTGDYFLGNIDEVAVFTEALSEQKIKEIFYAAEVAPFIVTQPQPPAGAVYAGGSVTITVVADGTPNLTYQWRKGGNELSGKTGASLTLDNLTVNDSGSFDVIVGNAYGTATSTAVQVNVQPANPPVITKQPAANVRFAGAKATFSVDVTGTPPFTYQWRKGANDLGGQTGATLTLNNLTAGDAGDYSVLIKNPVDQVGVASTAASLTVMTPTAAAAAVLSDSPMGYWRLGEASGPTANDAWAGHDGTYTGVVLGQPGYSVIDTDKAGGFSAAVDTHVALIDSALFDFSGATPSFTLETWAKFNSASGIQRIFANGTPGVSGIGFGINGNNRLRFTTYGVQDFDSDVFDPVLVPGKWYHLVAVIDTGTVQYYINGQPIGSSIAFSGPGRASGGTFQFGRNPAATTEAVDGTLDEIAIYNKALTSDRVLAHYTARYGNNTAPVFTLQPQPATIYAGRSATFSAAADGTEPITYQWKVNGAPVAGEVTESFTYTPAGVGNYTVVCTAIGAGSTDSTPVTLAVLDVPTESNVSQDLVVHLKFDSDYKDVSGHGNNGTSKGKPGFVVGKIGTKALHYNTDTASSTFNYVTLGKPNDLNLDPNVNFSVSFWIKFTGTPGDLPFLANNDNSMGDVGVTIAPSYGEGGWSWGLNDSVAPKAWPGIGLYDPVKNTLNDGEWHHVVHTFDRLGMATTYLNGLQVHQMSIASAAGWVMNSGKPWNIGQASGTYAESGDFQMDDLGVWRRALTPLEVDTIYQVGTKYGKPLAPDIVLNVSMTIEWSGNQLKISYSSGTLQSADSPVGPWTTVSGASAPSYLVTPSEAAKFYRVKVQ